MLALGSSFVLPLYYTMVSSNIRFLWCPSVPSFALPETVKQSRYELCYEDVLSFLSDIFVVSFALCSLLH